MQTRTLTLAVDPYFPDNTGEADVSIGILKSMKVDGFLISHDHWDHFDPDMIARFALKNDSWVIGPSPVIQKLRTLVPGLRLIQAEPSESQSLPLPSAESPPAGTLTVYRTPHGRIHLSFLLVLPEGRLYFDADNHNTRVLPTENLKPLDALFLYPWKQSGWRDFLGTVNPSFWFLVHLSKKETEEYREGNVPACLDGSSAQNPIVLCPGESQIIER